MSLLLRTFVKQTLSSWWTVLWQPVTDSFYFFLAFVFIIQSSIPRFPFLYSKPTHLYYDMCMTRIRIRVTSWQFQTSHKSLHQSSCLTSDLSMQTYLMISWISQTLLLIIINALWQRKIVDFIALKRWTFQLGNSIQNLFSYS